MVLYIISDDRLMKIIDLVKFKFHSNENIEWHYMQHEVNWIPIQLNKNNMQIGGKDIKNLIGNMVFKKTLYKTPFHISLLYNGFNKFHLKLTKWRFMKPKIILPKLEVQWNHCHWNFTITKRACISLILVH
jgi:hypothetical protein